MNHQDRRSVLACVGAVIGAGFVSGREIYSFFTRYGAASWGLILLASVTMVFLCALCMRRAQQENAGCWCGLKCFSDTKLGALARGCVAMLMLVTGGAMVSAAGHLVQLLWPSEWAYPLGAAGTLILAWMLGFRGVGPLSAVSGFLTVFFIGVMLVLLRRPGMGESVVQEQTPPGGLIFAAIRAVAYGSMNMTVAIGVTCRVEKGARGCRCCDRRALMTGLVLTGNFVRGQRAVPAFPRSAAGGFPDRSAVPRLSADGVCRLRDAVVSGGVDHSDGGTLCPSGRSGQPGRKAAACRRSDHGSSAGRFRRGVCGHCGRPVYAGGAGVSGTGVSAHAFFRPKSPARLTIVSESFTIILQYKRLRLKGERIHGIRDPSLESD